MCEIPCLCSAFQSLATEYPDTYNFPLTISEQSFLNCSIFNSLRVVSRDSSELSLFMRLARDSEPVVIIYRIETLSLQNCVQMNVRE